MGVLLMAGMAEAQVVLPVPVPSPVVPFGQTEGPATTPRQNAGSGDLQIGNVGPGLTTSVWQWKGLRVDRIQFEGVTFDAADTLPSELPQKAGEPLDPEKVRQSMRRLFASGRYRDIMVRGVRRGDAVTLIFAGPPRFYVGRVTIEGVKSERLTALLEYATKLTPGTALTQAAIPAGSEGIKQILQQQGYYESTISVKTVTDVEGAQMNVFYTVSIGPQARVGQVVLQGTDPGMTLEEFRKKGKLKTGSKVTRDTTSNALTKLRSQYQKRDRLEATVALQKQTYAPERRQLDYEFQANQGPEVKVLVEGAKFSKNRLHLLVPVFEEGTIDNDLLNEGVHNIRDYLQQQGYFDSSVDVKVIGEDTPSERVVFTIDRGIKHKVIAVDLKGNKYFESDLLRERMRVKKADAYLRSGRYSPALVKGDVAAIQSLYRANGFDKAEVKTEVRDSDTKDNGEPLKVGQIAVTYTVTEGTQQKFGKVDLAGVDAGRQAEIRGLMNAQEGQPFSLVTLSGDRDAVLAYYLSHGFDQAKVEIKQQKEGEDAAKTDVSLNVVEGQQVFIDKVLVSGIARTRPNVVQKEILVHPGDPLDQSALLETQRNLYNIALFNEVVTAVQNPAGDAPRKNVLVQMSEAKRWNVTYGFGFEAQTGTPSNGTISEASRIQLGLPPTAGISQEGKAGVSPRVSLDVSRINLRGTDDSLTLRSA